MNLANPRTHTDEVIRILKAGGLPVADGDSRGTDIPHVRVDRILDGITVGPSAAPLDDETMEWQLTCVAKSRQQADELAHLARTALANPAAWQIPGRALMSPPMFTAGPGTRRVTSTRSRETVDPNLYTAMPSVQVTTTPA